MKKTIIKKLISFSLVIAMLFTLGVQVQAAHINSADTGTYVEVDGIIYYITEEYDEIGTKIITVTGDGETVKVISDRETIVIETQEGIFSITDTPFMNNLVSEKVEELQQPMMIMSSQTYYNSARGYSYSYYQSGSVNCFTLNTPTNWKYREFAVGNGSAAMAFCSAVDNISNAYWAALSVVSIEVLAGLLLLGTFTGPVATGYLLAFGIAGVNAVTILAAAAAIDTAEKNAQHIFNDL